MAATSSRVNVQQLERFRRARERNLMRRVLTQFAENHNLTPDPQDIQNALVSYRRSQSDNRAVRRGRRNRSLFDEENRILGNTNNDAENAGSSHEDDVDSSLVSETNDDVGEHFSRNNRNFINQTNENIFDNLDDNAYLEGAASPVADNEEDLERQLTQELEYMLFFNFKFFNLRGVKFLGAVSTHTTHTHLSTQFPQSHFTSKHLKKQNHPGTPYKTQSVKRCRCLTTSTIMMKI